jgi:hypothetical protein
MASGGARNRSGPGMDPDSGRSDARGIVLTALPAEGYKGEAPDFPLPAASDRETELWAWAWSLPQAAAWAIQPWRWYSVGMWVRTAVLCESRKAQAADKNSLHRFADQIGLTPAGLKENGWKIAEDQTAAKRQQHDPEDEADDPRDRFTVVADGTGG